MIAPGSLRMRVWERGVGETMACGTGACAVAVAGRVLKGTDADVTIALPGGELNVDWSPGQTVLLTGPAVTVFAGQSTLLTTPILAQAGRLRRPA